MGETQIRFHDWCHIIVLYPSDGGELIDNRLSRSSSFDLRAHVPLASLVPAYYASPPSGLRPVIHAVVFCLCFCETFFLAIIKLVSSDASLGTSRGKKKKKVLIKKTVQLPFH
jgi:hypothetical protein